MPRNAKRVKAAYDSYTVTQGHTMKVLRSEILMLPSLIFWKFNGINLEFNHTWQMLDLAPALLYTTTFLEQQCYSFQCFAVCCYSISCLSWAGSYKKHTNLHQVDPLSTCLAMVQRYAKHANEIKWAGKQTTKEIRNAPESACFLRDQRPNILCAGAAVLEKNMVETDLWGHCAPES